MLYEIHLLYTGCRYPSLYEKHYRVFYGVKCRQYILVCVCTAETGRPRLAWVSPGGTCVGRWGDDAGPLGTCANTASPRVRPHFPALPHVALCCPTLPRVTPCRPRHPAFPRVTRIPTGARAYTASLMVTRARPGCSRTLSVLPRDVTCGPKPHRPLPGASA